ncbi:hypothetical protein BY996DRAFT_6480288 [Phakopsora pachyrhizi]|nr:hypothetical protein BY996DRAFT_6480288 [Phakopsora pachyrhizi]
MIDEGELITPPVNRTPRTLNLNSSSNISMPQIPPVVSPLRPNHHNSVSWRRQSPPVPPNQIGSNGLLR